MSLRKRQKLPTRRCEQPEELLKKSEETSFDVQNAQGYELDTLPPEVLEMVLRLLPLHDVATSVRLVSRHCSTVAGAVLNGAFHAAGSRMEALMVRVDGRMRSTKSDTELVNCSKALNALEVIRAQYKMLRAVTWRYTHPPTRRQPFPRLCFYAGGLLDNLNELLTLVARFHHSVVGPRNAHSSVACFSAACKKFLNFFEKVSERRVNRSALVSGCKIVDVLDCLMEGRQVLFFQITPDRRGARGTIGMKLRYVMKRAWFTCLSVSKNAEENSWRDEQRFMYLRLRRLVGSVNEHLFESLHYEHELLLQIPLTLPSRPPPASTYSGLNTAAVTLGSQQQVRPPPSLDLVVEIELKCTPELAPLAIRAALKSDEFEAYKAKTLRHQQLFLRMSVACPASTSNRLPGNFVWELRSPRRTRRNS